MKLYPCFYGRSFRINKPPTDTIKNIDLIKAYSDVLKRRTIIRSVIDDLTNKIIKLIEEEEGWIESDAYLATAEKIRF